MRFNSKEHERFLHMFERSGMAHPSVFIKAQFFGETFHVVTFDKGLYEYYTKLSDFHAQFRMVGNNYNQTLKELRSHFFRAQGNGTDLQTGEVHAAVSRDCYEDCGTYTVHMSGIRLMTRLSSEIWVDIQKIGRLVERA